MIRLSWCRPFLGFIFWWTDRQDARHARRESGHGALPVPPATLRFRVSHILERDEFIASGQRSNEAIKSALQRVGKSLADFSTILDFGCGCGRMTRGMIREAPHAQFHGTDIDAEAVAWCASHLAPAQFAVNQPHPPLRYSDATFDLIYSHSVFTHIDEEAGLFWIKEFHRILQPGGYAVFTVHGESAWRSLPTAQVKHIEQHGFLFIQPGMGTTDGAFHTREYLERVCQPDFKLIDYAPRAMLDYQDIVVLKKN